MDNDFKFDDINKKNSTANKKINNIIAISVSIIFIIVFFIVFNTIFKTKQEIKKEYLDINTNSKEVQNLYNMVKYSPNNITPKYIKENEVNLNSFTNYEKYYYSLYFLKEKDILNEKITNQEYYYITDNKINNYMRKYFGDTVKYNKNIEIDNLPIMKLKNNHNKAKLIYKNKYFIETKEEQTIENKIENTNYLTKLIKAQKEGNNFILNEKIIYIKCLPNNEEYLCTIYKDYEKTIKLKENIKIKELKDLSIKNIEDSETIEYIFTKNIKGEYSFNSSKKI